MLVTSIAWMFLPPSFVPNDILEYKYIVVILLVNLLTLGKVSYESLRIRKMLSCKTNNWHTQNKIF